MEEKYVKEINIHERSDKEKDIELIKSIINSKNNVIDARNNFEFAEGELIDYYAYYIKAEQSKLDYLIKKAKLRKIDLTILNEAIS